MYCVCKIANEVIYGVKMREHEAEHEAICRSKGWESSHTMPQNRNKIYTFIYVKEKIKHEWKPVLIQTLISHLSNADGVLKRATTSEFDPQKKATKKLFFWFSQCMNPLVNNGMFFFKYSV